MKLMMCFGGAAAVADDEAAAAEARHRGRREGRSMSFRMKFFSGKGGKNKASPLSEAKKRGVVGADDDVYAAVAGASTASSSVPSSAPLSSAASLDSSAASLSSSCSSSSVSPSSSFSGALLPPAKSPAAGAAAVVLCLLMVVFCGRVGATLLTSTALYLFPRRWPATACKLADDDSVEGSSECDAVSAASEAEEETAKRKVVMEGFLIRNRKK